MSEQQPRGHDHDGDGVTVVPTFGESAIQRAAIASPEFVDLSFAAKAATDNERSMTLLQGIKLYPKAVGWSMLLSTCIVMEGYDLVLLGSFYALPQFQNKYGFLQPDGTKAIPAPWKSGLSNGQQVGEIMGLAICGLISERLGYRRTMLLALSLITGLIFILFFSPNVQVLLVGEILCGIPWGIFQTITTAYASEVAPVVLRPYLTTYVNMCWVFGQFIASGVLRGVLTRTDVWAYRIPFALQWFWPVPLIIGVFLAPESPWWLIRHDRPEEAKKALLRLTSQGDETFNADETIAMMSYTNQIEKQMSAGTTYAQCFRGVDRRRTEIACLTWLCQAMCGSSIQGFSTYFYQQAGLNDTGSFDLSLGQYALGIVGTLGSWFLMNWFGRRTLYLSGLCVQFIILMVVGFVSLAPQTTATGWATGSLILISTFVYDGTIGPVCYAIVAEISSTCLKGKTIVLARNLYNIGGIINNVLVNFMITPKPSGWGWDGKAGFFYGGLCCVCILWCFFRLPEPNGRSYAELDILFERKIPARKFAKTNIDIFNPRDLEVEREKLVAAEHQEFAREK